MSAAILLVESGHPRYRGPALVARHPALGSANHARISTLTLLPRPQRHGRRLHGQRSLWSNQSGEGDIRKNIIEADLVDCVVALPGQLFYTTQIPVCFLTLANLRRRVTLISYESQRSPDTHPPY